MNIVCGSFWGKTGPVDGIAAEPNYLDVSVPPGTEKGAFQSRPRATPSPMFSPAPGKFCNT